MLHMKKLLGATLSIAFALPSIAQQAAFKPAAAPAKTTTTAAQQSAPPKLSFEKYKLKNGLEVILSEDHRLPLVAVNLWYHVGPANEVQGRTGFAHLFEHMMFQGSKHIGDDQHFKILEGAGASDINGTTDFDRTNYFETLPSNQLEMALWLESDRMGFLLETLDAGKLANQRDVVRNERRQSVENAPYELAEEAMYHTIFPKDHPYYAYVIGSHQDIEAAQLDDVRGFFKQYYAPNNASLAIVGDFTKAQAKQLVEKYFGPIAAGEPVPKITAQTPAITSERRKVVTDQVQLPRIYMAWITDPIYKPGDAEADVLARILGGGKSSRLYKKLVYERQIAQDVFTQQNSLILGSVFQIRVTAKPGVKIEDIERAIDEELDTIRKSPPTADEVAGARNQIQAGIIRNLETLGGFGGVADRLNQYNHYLGTPDYLAQDLSRYDKVTPADVQKVAQEKLANNERVVIHAVPGEKVINDPPKTEEKEQPETARTFPPDPKSDWRKQQPGPGPASKLTLPVPASFKLANGLTVLYTERHTLPIIAANLVVLSGSEANPINKPGLAAFAADMLDEGTNRRGTLQIAEDLDRAGATLATSATADFASVSLRSLSKNVDQAFDLLSDVSLNPAFQQRELDRVRSQRLTQLVQERDNPSQLVIRVFYKAIYGEKHPYGFVDLGTEEAIKGTSRDDLMGFWKSGYQPQNAALVVAGDVTEKQLRALAEKYFGKWAKGETKHAPALDDVAATSRRIVVVDKPGSPQTRLRVGQLGVKRSNPDYVPMEVMNTMLGGLFSSRINMNLREKHGYTYGAGSAFIYRRGPGPFFVSTGVRSDTTAASVKEIFNEIDGMRSKPMTTEELAISKDSIARSLPGQFETSPNAAATIGSLFVYNLPLDYYRTLPAKIEAVTAADAQRVAEKYLRPEQMVVAAVGDRAKIEPELSKLQLGPVLAVDMEGNVLEAKRVGGGK
jgi:zinc protease